MSGQSNEYLPNDSDKALRYLAHGLDLVRAKNSDKPIIGLDVIWALVEEAVETMDRLPDREKAWLRIGSVAAGFTGAGMTRRELQVLEQLRYLCAMKPYDGQTARVIDREQADRAYEVLTWLRWIGVHVACKDPMRMRKAAVSLARGGDSTPFHRIWRPGAKVHRQAVVNFRIQFCGHLMEGLRRDLNLISVGDGYFTRTYPEAAVA